MVHHELHSLRVGIFIEPVKVEVGVRGLEVEDIVLGLAEPVFPSDVPSFHQDLVETVLCGEVDIPADILVVCSVKSVGLCL